MEIVAAERFVKSLMRDNGLESLPFAWDRAVTSYGRTLFVRDRLTREVSAEKITLSKPLIPFLDTEQVHEIALHEIGHALAGYYAAHGPEWRSIVRQIGGNPQRTYDAVSLEDRAKVSKYVIRCATTDKIIAVRQRSTGMLYLCNCCGRPAKVIANR